ncbi:MAG: FHA domain-containing protein [Ectothiorhodospiraceae bacterium]|nr:FHA domain-containing protein [Ectothiorhodospiraceae bacterium]
MDNKLILTLDGEIINEYGLNVEHISIGRKHGNDIQLNDLTVSGRHAMLSNSLPHQVFVEDLGSTNGTLVNGNHIKKTSLTHGDIIQIGHHQFTFLSDGEAKYEPTMFIKAEMDETQMVLPEWESREESIKGQPLAGLRTLNGPLARTVMELRKPFNTVGFQGHKLALISRGLNSYSISQVHSTNNRRGADKPLLNGETFGAAPLDLKEKDIINIAGFEVEFYYIH